jgi:hypothetical protein
MKTKAWKTKQKQKYERGEGSKRRPERRERCNIYYREVMGKLSRQHFLVKIEWRRGGAVWAAKKER